MELIDKVLLRDSLWYLRLEKMKIQRQCKGFKSHELYNVWISMLNRCYNPVNPSFRIYGARGISVCDRWLNIENFIKDMGNRSGLTLDRIDGDGDYSLSNCRWATSTMQAKNKRVKAKIQAQKKLDKIMRVKRVNTGITNIVPCYSTG